MKKLIKLNLIGIFTIISLIILATNSNAASAKINANNEVEVGTPINISVTGSGVQWNLKLLVNGQEIANSSELENYQSNKSISFSKTYTPTSTGSLKIELEGSVTEYNDGSTVTTFASKTVTVKAKETPKQPDGANTENNGGTTNKPTVTEPKFTSASKTVYATGDINLRSSWSTSSSATKVAKGTELRLTGTSTDKVNGYVWYRVTYNGQTKYVVNNLVTDKKPEEEKSNNTNLKTLSIENVELSPTFSADVLQYTAKINGYKEKEIKVIAEVEDEKATVKVEGNTNIIAGENVITAEVTAEDGTKKTYKIILTNEQETISLGLQSLKIKDVELKGFSPDKFEYEVSFKDLEKLEIEAIANEEGAIIEISGNENLTEYGEHLITIMVTSADGTQVVNYQIKANKLKQEMQNTKNGLDIKNILICGIAALIILTLIIVLIVKYVKRK